ncbi:MAG: hypothetical protein IT447_12325 [Phycisphaerales bacterium]|nr:hypothetical protein [Phycisphaerales bacterium]
MQQLLNWLRGNDIPNWVTFLLPILGGFFTRLYYRRPYRNLPNLDVALKEFQGTIDKQSSHAIKIVFKNKTGKSVKVMNAYVTKVTLNMPLHTLTDRDCATGNCELKFRDDGDCSYYNKDVFDLQPDHTCETAIYTREKPSDELLQCKSIWWRQLLRRPRYFVLNYLTMIDYRLYMVKTVL